MKILKINSTENRNNNFKALKLSYGIEQTLIDSASSAQISNMFEAGKKLENTQFFDLLVLSDLTMRIKEKGNPFLSLTEPIRVHKHSNKQIRIVGIYDGVENENNKIGQKYSVLLKYDKPETVDNIVNDLQQKRGIVRLATIAKIIDDYFVKTKLQQKTEKISRANIISILMNKYGDIVR